MRTWILNCIRSMEWVILVLRLLKQLATFLKKSWSERGVRLNPSNPLSLRLCADCIATSSLYNFMCMQWIVLDIAIGSLCLGFIICQCCYEVSVYKWFIIHTFILNALLERVLLAYTHCILSYLKYFICLNFLLTVCLLFCYRNCSIYII